MNFVTKMAWLWYATAWVSLLSAIFYNRPYQLVVVATVIPLWIAMLWEGQRE